MIPIRILKMKRIIDLGVPVLGKRAVLGTRRPEKTDVKKSKKKQSKAV
jgi:hypothetical protein